MIGQRAATGTTFAVAALLGWAACATASGQGDLPAVLTKATAESRAELARKLREALHGVPITIADDALTRDSTLIIERTHPRTADGVPLSGRETGRPEHFRLVKKGSRCVLVHERTHKRWTLEAATCRAADGEADREIVRTMEALEQEWFQVYETHDLSALHRLIADDFVATLADGTMRGKAAHIAAYPADFETLASVTNSELRVRVFGPDLAVATGLYTAVSRGKGGPGARTRYRYTDTWLRRKGSWQCVATHENRVD